MTDVVATIRAERVVAVLRAVEEVDRVVGDLVGGGITCLEITMDSPGAADAIARAAARGDAVVGAGTVRTAAEVDAAVAAGAAFCVSPGTVEAVLSRCADHGVPAIPGALTPTEIERAWALGAAMVKVFPASVGGPAYLRAIRAPLAGIPLIVTGGVGAGNAAEFLRAGADAVGVGGALVGGGARVRGEAEALARAVREA